VQPNRQIGVRCVAVLMAAFDRAVAPGPTDSVSLPAFLREGESCARASSRGTDAPRRSTAGRRPAPVLVPSPT
jgi:hypothetical protein